MNTKKLTFTFTLVCTALLLLTASCRKENSLKTPDDGAAAPVLHAYDASTKTALGNDWSVAWTDDDRLTVFNAAAGGTTFSDNCQFVLEGEPEEGLFVKDPGETGKSLVSGESAYDWYVCSPWMQYGAQPGGTRGYGIATKPKQFGYNSTAHIATSDLMAGVAYGVADGTIPSIALHHVGCLMKFTVTNDTGGPAIITGLTLDASAGGAYIVGGFTMDWGNASTIPSLSTEDMATHAYSCELSVVNSDSTPISETIAAGESVDLYMVVAPFSIPAGGKIKLTISGSLGSLEQENTFPAGISFAAGTYNTANLSYTNPSSLPEGMVFKETFGTRAGLSMTKYDKAGLTTGNPEDAEGYSYGGTAVIQTTDHINWTSYGSYLDGAVARFASTQAQSLYITGVKVEANTTYIFQYNKSRGMKSDGTEFDTPTRVRWRKNGATSWPTSATYNINETSDVGTITQELTFGSETIIDIGVFGEKNPVSITGLTYCPAIDLLILTKK